MNILFVWTGAFKNGGGVGRVTRTLTTEFVRRGHTVTYLSCRDGNDYEVDGIKHHFCPDNQKILTKSNIEYTRNLIVSTEPDMIINQAGVTGPDVLQLLKISISEIKRENEINIFTVHHNCIKCLYKNFELVVQENYKNHRFSYLFTNPLVLKLLKIRHKRKYGNTFRKLISDSDKLVLLSEKFIDDLGVYLQEFPKNKVCAIPNPAPFKIRNTEDIKENRLLYVGRIDFQQKRADLLLDVWEKVYAKYPDWEFDVVGDGVALEEMKKIAEQKKLKRIHFHGFNNPEPYLEKAKYFVMTSAFEGFPMVLVEAQAYGVVPIAFRTFNSLSDVVTDGENGAIVEPYDLDAFTKRLGDMIENENNRKKMAQLARDKVTQFSPDEIAAIWEKRCADYNN